MNTDDLTLVRLDVVDRIAIATLDRPEAGNSMRASELEEVPRLLERIDVDDDILATVVTGAGREAYSSHSDIPNGRNVLDYVGPIGADAHPYVGPMAPAFGEILATADGVRAMVARWTSFRKPVVVALNGLALGHALTQALAIADVIIAERHVRIREAHVTSGMSAPAAAFFWPMSIGMMRAKKYVLTGDWLGAEEAVRIGLFTEVVDAGDSLRRALEYARHLAALPAEAVAEIKAALAQWYRTFEPTIFHPALLRELALHAGDVEGGEPMLELQHGARS